MITDRLTAENATSAPKLTSAINTVRSIHSATSEITDTTRMANTGVAKRADTYPNTLRGRIPSRPIANRIRDTDACDVSADPTHPATYAAVKNMFRNCPPAASITSSEPESTSSNALDGNTNCDTYDNAK